MRFKGLFKLSLAASVAVCANGAGESVLSGVEVTSSSASHSLAFVMRPTAKTGILTAFFTAFA